jgi:DNA primase
MTSATDLRSEPLVYHQRLPPRIRKYLNERGIPTPLIHKHLLGWNGERITIPIPDRETKIAFFKLAKDPEDHSDSPKMLATPGTHAELYGWERVLAKPHQIIICEGEFDRLVLENQGFAAVTSTGGAGVFPPEWAKEFEPIPEVYICFDRDEAGRSGALRLGRLIPDAKLVELPDEVGDAGDVTDFFVRLGRSREDFLQLLDNAQPAPQDEGPQFVNIGPALQRRKANEEVEQLKRGVLIENVVSSYVQLRRSGKNFVGQCPFHDDRIPSFVVYPVTQSFYCFGCKAHGDVAGFLMRIEKLTFPEVLRTLRELAN